jgi:hypothetical protein
LACDDTFVEVSIAEFAYVDLWSDRVSEMVLDVVGTNTNANLRPRTRIRIWWN